MATPDTGRTSATTPPRSSAGAGGPSGEADAAGPPDPLDRAGLKADALRKRAAWGRARREGAPLAARSMALLGWMLAKLNAWRPMRVWTLYTRRHGPLMAAGSAYNMFFSVAALLVAGFSIFGMVASGNPGLQNAVVDTVAEATPGLIDTGEGGLATPEQLFNSGSFGWALAISTATMLLTSLGWIAGLREGMRGVFGLPPLAMNPVLLKLKDLGVLLILGLSLVVTTVVGLVAGAALELVIDLLNIQSGFAIAMTRVTSIVVMLLLDAAAAVVLFRLASGIRMPRVAMLQSALIAGAGSTVLRYFSSELLGGATKNPILASFAVILGLFIWFFFLSQVYLIATSWGAVAKADSEARHAARAGGAQQSLKRQSALRRGADGVGPVSGWPPRRRPAR